MLVYLQDPTDIESIQWYRPKNNTAANEYVRSISNGYIVEIFREESPWSIRQRRDGNHADILKYSVQLTQIYIEKYVRNLSGDCHLVENYNLQGQYSNTCLKKYTHSNIAVNYPGEKIKYFTDGNDNTLNIFRNELPHKSLNDFTGYIDMVDLPLDTLFNLTLEYPVSLNVDPSMSCDVMYNLGIEIHQMYLKKFGKKF